MCVNVHTSFAVLSYFYVLLIISYRYTVWYRRNILIQKIDTTINIMQHKTHLIIKDKNKIKLKIEAADYPFFFL